MRTGKEWQRLHYSYLRQYNEQTKNMLKKYGKYMTAEQKTAFKAWRKEEKLTDYWNFRNAYTISERQRIEQQKQGIRGKSLNVMRDLLTEQQYPISLKRGRSLLKAKRDLLKGKIEWESAKISPDKELIKSLREEKSNLRLDKLRMGLINVQDVIDAAIALNQQLKMDPDYIYDSGARAKEIAVALFGS